MNEVMRCGDEVGNNGLKQGTGKAANPTDRKVPINNSFFDQYHLMRTIFLRIHLNPAL